MKAIIHISIIILLIPYLVTAKELIVYFPDKMPPWAIQKNHSGFAPELIKRTLERKGYKITPIYVPLPRLLHYAKNKKGDVITMIEAKNLKTNYSDIISYFNTSLISLEKNNFKITNIKELNNKSIIAFKGASDIFKEFKNISIKNPQYLEMNNQKSQVMMFFEDRVDFILIDEHIFLYWKKDIKKNFNTSLKYKIYDLSSFSSIRTQSPFYFAFKDIKIRNEFNKELEKLIKNGEFFKIHNKFKHQH